jgi:hypothetical protein
MVQKSLETEKNMGKNVFSLLPLAYLISSRRASFCVTFSAVNWPGSVRLEWNFTFLLTISANCLINRLKKSKRNFLRDKAISQLSKMGLEN